MLRRNWSLWFLGAFFDKFYMFERYFTPLILLYCAPLDEFLRVIFVHFGALSRGRGTGVNPKVVTSVQAYLMTDFIVHWSYYWKLGILIFVIVHSSCHWNLGNSMFVIAHLNHYWYLGIWRIWRIDLLWKTSALVDSCCFFVSGWLLPSDVFYL